MKDLIDSGKCNDIKFFSIGSGSSGNCYYLAYRNTQILIDLGLRSRLVADTLKSRGIDPNKLDAILITHDHADHVKGVGVMSTKYQIPIYATHPVMYALVNSRYIQEDITAYVKPVICGETFSIKDFFINSVHIPHDSSDNVGYIIECESGIFSILTDVGAVTDEVRYVIRQSNFLILESNYDTDMLQTGRYPYFLKKRICSGIGHLSNTESANCLAENYHLDLKFVGLCHLSKDNNHPDLAYKCFDQRLFKEGIRVGKDLHLSILKRSTPSDIYYFKKGTLPFIVSI